jgi:hypothetical protein
MKRCMGQAYVHFPSNGVIFLKLYECDTDPGVYFSVSITSAIPTWQHLAKQMSSFGSRLKDGFRTVDDGCRNSLSIIASVMIP